MINTFLKKIGLFCLGVASLCLVGCFHIPDEDRLPSRNKVKTEEVKKDVELEQAVDSFMNGIDKISSEWNEMKNNEENDVEIEGLGEIIDVEVEDEEVDDENNESSLGEMLDSIE